MIKSELVASLASQMTHLTEKKVAESVNYILDRMSHALHNGQRIEVRGFGSFSLHYHESRNAHNPKTGKKLVTSAKYSIHFKPGKELRDRINASRLHKPMQDSAE